MLPSVTILRTFSTIAIVFFHCLCIYSHNWGSSTVIFAYDFIANIIVYPSLITFTVISGYLFSLNNNWTLRSVFIKKSQRLIVPYLFWGLISYSLGALFEYDRAGVVYGHLWYLRMLFLCFVVTQIIRPYIAKLNTKLLFVLLLITSCLFYRSGTYPMITEFMMYYPAFLLGFVWSDKSFINRFKLPIWLPAILIIITFIIMYQYVDFWSRLHRLVLPLGMILATSIFRFLDDKQAASQKIADNALVLMVTKYSFGIYLIHHIILGVLLNMTFTREFLYSHYIVGLLVVFIFVMLVSVLVSRVISSNMYLKKTI